MMGALARDFSSKARCYTPPRSPQREWPSNGSSRSLPAKVGSARRPSPSISRLPSRATAGLCSSISTPAPRPSATRSTSRSRRTSTISSARASRSTAASRISTTSSIRSASSAISDSWPGRCTSSTRSRTSARRTKARLIEAINGLDADYVILDMRAGLDSNVIDFLPFSNSGRPDLHAASSQRHARGLGHRQGDPLPQTAADLQQGVAVFLYGGWKT